jgi:hypothetical protein
LQDATAGDFQGAIGAALAANDKGQAEHSGCVRPRSLPARLRHPRLAARFEQARGDNARAADYWRASLAAMPEVSPPTSWPTNSSLPRPSKTAARRHSHDLANLLNPDRPQS